MVVAALYLQENVVIFTLREARKQCFQHLNYHKILSQWIITYTLPERKSAQSDKIWKQENFKSPNFPLV